MIQLFPPLTLILVDKLCIRKEKALSIEVFKKITKVCIVIAQNVLAFGTTTKPINLRFNNRHQPSEIW